LNINPQANWVGTLPDGLVIDPSEQQANNGLVEIKCPASAKNTPLIDLCAKSNFCLQWTATGMELKKQHNYYNQMQGQFHAACRQ